MDIGTEELSHLEVDRHPRPAAPEADEDDRGTPPRPIRWSPSPGAAASTCSTRQGNPWTADYLKITGELDVDLRSNIAAEARAKIVYERLINFTDDAGTKEALQFLMTREITHMKAFMQALESLGKDPLSIGQIPPTPGLVDQYFNDSTGEGDDGETDARGPWNEGDGWQIVEAPAFTDLPEKAEKQAAHSAKGRNGKGMAPRGGRRASR